MLGETTGRMAEWIKERGWGRVWIARGRRIYTYPGEPWILDNGVFRDHRAGRHWSSNAFYGAMSQANAQETPPLGVCLPDVYAEGARSLARSVDWADRFTEGSYPWFLVLQDGMTPEMILPHVGRLAGLFLGGTDAFKVNEAELWAGFARARNLWFHYGRCGTPGKVRHAKRIGADSIDSALPMWSKGRLAAFEAAVRGDQMEMALT
jgi:hypothetical protein